MRAMVMEHPHPTSVSIESPAVALGAALRVRRKVLGISMTAAAAAAGMSRVTWHRLEKGAGTVAVGAMLAAAGALGLEVRLVAPGDRAAELPDRTLPLDIRLKDYPQLRSLAWQVQDGQQRLAPREAYDLYLRNWRHVAVGRLSPHERSLIRALGETFGEAVGDV